MPDAALVARVVEDGRQAGGLFPGELYLLVAVQQLADTFHQEVTWRHPICRKSVGREVDQLFGDHQNEFSILKLNSVNVGGINEEWIRMRIRNLEGTL